MSLLLLMGGRTPFSGALNTLGTGLESAWSVGRRLREGYNGPIIRVRRSSDNAESDFSGSGASGAVDPAAVAAFCGAGDGLLTTIYGQSGHGRNLTQATTTIQPAVCLSGVAQTVNGRLAAVFDGATSVRRMSVASSTGIYNFLHNGTSSTGYLVSETDDTAATKTLFSNHLGTSQIGSRISFTSDERLALTVRTTNPNVAISVNKGNAGNWNGLHLTSFYVDADNATAGDREDVWRNGTIQSTNNTSTHAPSAADSGQDFNIGTPSPGNTSEPYSGKFCELVLWSQNVTASRTTWEANAKSFWGTP